MQNILKIKKPTNSSHIVWEHLLKSVLGFTGTFALLFFGPMMLSARTHSRDSDSFGIQIIQFLFTHPEVQISLCILAVLIYNIIIFTNNSKFKYLVRIDLDEKLINIGVTNLYYKTVKYIYVTQEELEYEVITNTTDIGGKESILNLIDKKTRTIIATILPTHIIWCDQLRDIKFALSELKKIGISKTTKSVVKKSLLLGLIRDWKFIF